MLAVLLDRSSSVIIVVKIGLLLLPHLLTAATAALSVNEQAYLDFKVYLTYAPVMTSIEQENNVIQHKVQHFVQITIFSPTHSPSQPIPR